MARKFPLVIWEETGEFKQEYEQVKKRFKIVMDRLSDIGFECTYLGNLTMNIDGYPQVLLNDNGSGRCCKSSEDAIRCALRYGDTGWWTLNELEQFVDSKGPIFESAMWDMGYRKNKIDSMKWTVRSKNDQRPQFHRQTSG